MHFKGGPLAFQPVHKATQASIANSNATTDRLRTRPGDTIMNMHVMLQGFLVSGGLIIAIGAQNAHVLRMGLMRQHVALTVAICAASDALLIGLGISGMGTLLDLWPQAVQVMTWAGAAFLFWYGVRALRSAISGAGALQAKSATSTSVRSAVLMVLAFTYLNPHAYLDTIVLIGSIGGRLTHAERPIFWAGCMLASTSWFVMLGYGARWLAPLFSKPFSWRVLDALIGMGMGALALNLLHA
jgi:L-lysine exporter family protein LysE/ArgO